MPCSWAQGGEVVELEAVVVQGRGGGAATATGLNLSTHSRGGSRLDLTPLETPASIEIIPGEKIRARGQNSVTEAVSQNATGITSIAAPGNGGTAFTSRGFSGVNSVMTLYDGTRLYVGSGTVSFPFDTWNVERIEVLRGPASVLYGEGAIGGVINVVPKKPSFVAVNEAQAVIGGNGRKRLSLDSGGALSEQVAYRFNISGDMSDGWLKQNGEVRNLALSGALLYQATPELAFTLSNDYGHQEPMRYFGTPLVGGRLDRALRFNNYNVNDSAIRFRDNWTQFKTEWNPNAEITIRNTAYRLTSDRRWRDLESYAFMPATGLISRTNYIAILHNQEQIGNRFDATLRHDILGFKNAFVAGFDVNRITFKHASNTPYGGTSVVDPMLYAPGLFLNRAGTRPAFRTKTDQVSLFAEDRLSITDQLALVAGVRYEAPRIARADLVTPASSFTQSFEAVSYRVGMVYNPLPTTAFYAQYATGVDPVGSLISLSAAQKNFQLSTGRQVEVGFKQSFWGGRGEFTLAGYRITKDNLLSADATNPSLTVQVGSQSAQGIEAFLSLGLWESVRLEGNAALLRAQYDTFQQSVAGVAVSYRGKQPQDVPERVANLWLSWAFAPRMEARAGVQYVGATFGDFANTARRPAYAVVNASLDYQVTDNSRFSLRGYNLLDKVYAVKGSSTMWLLGQPRTVELAYNVSF